MDQELMVKGVMEQSHFVRIIINGLFRLQLTS